MEFTEDLTRASLTESLMTVIMDGGQATNVNLGNMGPRGIHALQIIQVSGRLTNTLPAYPHMTPILVECMEFSGAHIGTFDVVGISAVAGADPSQSLYYLAAPPVSVTGVDRNVEPAHQICEWPKKIFGSTHVMPTQFTFRLQDMTGAFINIAAGDYLYVTMKLWTDPQRR